MSAATSENIIRNLQDRIAVLEDRLRIIKAEFELFELPGVKLTNSQRTIVKILFDAKGRPISRGHLYDALYALKPEADWAEDKIIDVFVSKIRQKLKGTQWEIVTVYGVGYSLVEREGAKDGV